MKQAPIVHRTEGRVLGSFARDWRADRPDEMLESLVVCDPMLARRIVVDTESVSGTCEFACLEPGLYLSLLDLNLSSRYHSRVVGEDLLEFNFRLSGDVSLNGEWGQITIDRPSTLIWYQPEGLDDVWEELGTDSAPVERSVTLYCERWWIQRLIDSSPGVSESLGEIISGGRRQPGYRIVDNQPTCIDAINSLFSNGESGPLRLFFLKAKGYELLASVLRSLAPVDAAAGRYFTRRDRDNIAQAKAILEAEFAAPPPVARLARRVGVNETKLNMGLRQLHGHTAQQIVRRRRLERACELLRTTDLPVSEVGFTVGYAHHSTFTAAFVERFGVSPKRFSLSNRHCRA